MVAAVHGGPYLAPGDLSANRHVLDGLIATTLRVPQAGVVTLKRARLPAATRPAATSSACCWMASASTGSRPTADYCARLDLPAGDHAMLIDWNGRCHDMDVTFTASGMDGLAMVSPLPGEPGTWAIANQPGAARAAAAAAASPEALLPLRRRLAAGGRPWTRPRPISTWT